MSESVAHQGDPASETVTRPVRLKEAREAAGLHIAALAAALKVPVRKLEALEAGRYDELPDLTFARALASSACRQLRVDPVPILQQMPQGASPRLGQPGHALNAPFNPGHDEVPFEPLSWLSRPALLAAIALLLGALVIVFLPRTDSPPVPPPVAGTAPEPVRAADPAAAQEPVVAGQQEGAVTAPPAPLAADPTAVPGGTTMAPAEPPVSPPEPSPNANPSAAAAAAEPAPSSAGSLLSIAATGESWVEVVNGSGQVVVKRLLRPGDVIDFSVAPPYTVVLGKVDAVQVSVRGKSFDTAPWARNNVARFEVK